MTFELRQNTVSLQVAQDNTLTHYEFGFGMYVDGRFIKKSHDSEQIESGSYSFVAADKTLYSTPWQVRNMTVFVGSFIQQAIVEIWDAWRTPSDQPLFPTYVAFTLANTQA